MLHRRLRGLSGGSATVRHVDPARRPRPLTGTPGERIGAGDEPGLAAPASIQRPIASTTSGATVRSASPARSPRRARRPFPSRSSARGSSWPVRPDARGAAPGHRAPSCRRCADRCQARGNRGRPTRSRRGTSCTHGRRRSSGWHPTSWRSRSGRCTLRSSSRSRRRRAGCRRRSSPRPGPPRRHRRSTSPRPRGSGAHDPRPSPSAAVGARAQAELQRARPAARRPARRDPRAVPDRVGGDRRGAARRRSPRWSRRARRVRVRSTRVPLARVRT